MSQVMQVLVKPGRAKEVSPLESTEVTLVTPCAQKTPFRLLTARTVRELICFIYHQVCGNHCSSHRKLT